MLQIHHHPQSLECTIHHHNKNSRLCNLFGTLNQCVKIIRYQTHTYTKKNLHSGGGGGGGGGDLFHYRNGFKRHTTVTHTQDL
jgi:hypothetical protein